MADNSENKLGDRLRDKLSQLDAATLIELNKIYFDLTNAAHIKTPEGNEIEKPTSIAQNYPPTGINKEDLKGLINLTTAIELSFVTNLYICMQHHNEKIGEKYTGDLQEIRTNLLANYQRLCHGAGLRAEYETRFLTALEKYIRSEIKAKLNLDSKLGIRIMPERDETPGNGKY